MWAAGVVELGLTADYLWSLTPAEYTHLFDAHLRREDRANRRAALICSYVANFAGKQRTEGAGPLSVEEVLGYGVSSEARSFDELNRFRRQVEQATPERYLDRLRAADPLADITMTAAVAETFPEGMSGTWSKLGTREGLVQPLVVAEVMAARRGKQ